MSGRAVFSRNDVYIAPVEINRSGDYRYYLWPGIWNVDSDASTPESRDGFEYITVLAYGEPLQLELKGWTPDAIGTSEPIITKPAGAAADIYYAVSLAQLRRRVEASELRVEIGGGDRGAYGPWDDQEPGKATLNELLNGPDY